jgi:hypothetical protein
LEFTLRPSFDAVCEAATEEELAGAILPTIGQIEPELEKHSIPDFDSKHFVSDLEGFFRRVAKGGGTLH